MTLTLNLVHIVAVVFEAFLPYVISIETQLLFSKYNLLLYLTDHESNKVSINDSYIYFLLFIWHSISTIW